jgi:hypothetical protein
VPAVGAAKSRKAALGVRRGERARAKVSREAKILAIEPSMSGAKRYMAARLPMPKHGVAILDAAARGNT